MSSVLKSSGSLERWVSPLVLFLATFALYLSTLAPGMLRGDSGEFQWAMAALNVAHATGYPLFTLLGYGWHLVPLANNVAWQLNLLAALFGALAVLTIWVFIRSLTGSGAAGWIGALFFALAPVIWFNASILEVYTFHAFLLALLLYLLWRWSRAPQTSAFLYGAFFLLGLALAHHRLIVLALPGILYFLLAADRRFWFDLRRLIFCALLLLPGLLLYVYVPLRLLPDGFTLDFALYDVILGREYAGSLLQELKPFNVLVEIPWNNFHVGLVLAGLGAFTLFRSARHLNVALWLVYVVDVLFALLYSVPDIEVFLTSSFVVTALWIGAGSAFVIEWLGSRVGETRRARVQLAAAGVLVLVALVGLARYPGIQTAVAGEAAPEARARAIAASPQVPPGAWLELDWETATALRFLQATEHLRPDLEVRLIELNKPDEYWRTLVNVGAGRPVLVERGVPWQRAPAGYATEPVENDLAQIVYTAPEMKPVRVPVSESVELEGYRWTGDELVMYWRVKQPLARDLATFVHFLDAAGNKIGQDDRAGCCEAVYGYRTGEWEPGRVYADRFKPAPPGTASLLVGLYENVNGDIEPYGETITIKP